MTTYPEKIIEKFGILSERFHRLSFLFYELQQSLKKETRNMTTREFKKYLKEELKLDIEKIEKITTEWRNVKMGDIRK